MATDISNKYYIILSVVSLSSYILISYIVYINKDWFLGVAYYTASRTVMAILKHSLKYFAGSYIFRAIFTNTVLLIKHSPIGKRFMLCK